MPNPSEAELQDQIGKGIWILENLRIAGSTASPNLLSNLDAFTQALEGNRATAALNGADAIRSRFASLLTPEAGRAILDPLWIEYGKVLGFYETEVKSIIRRLRENFAAGSKDVDSSEFSFGTVTASGSPVGTGVINRLTVDEDGFALEAALPEVKTFRVVRDEHTGAAEHEEVFLAYGEPAERDLILLDGSGKTREMASVSARTSLLRNSSFDQWTGTASSSPGIPGWTVSTAANVQVHSDDYYRDAPNVTTPYSLRLDDNVAVSQNFNVQNIRLEAEVPYYAQVAWNSAIGSGDGLLTLTLGSQTASISVSGVAGWNILRIAIGTKNWPRNFNMEDPTVAVTLSSRTSGYTLIDDVILAPFVAFDNTWWLPVGGVTPWLIDDAYTATDTAVDAGVIQRWLRRLYGQHLPSQSDASETWADPS